MASLLCINALYRGSELRHFYINNNSQTVQNIFPETTGWQRCEEHSIWCLKQTICLTYPPKISLSAPCSPVPLASVPVMNPAPYPALHQRITCSPTQLFYNTAKAFKTLKFTHKQPKLVQHRKPTSEAACKPLLESSAWPMSSLSCPSMSFWPLSTTTPWPNNEQGAFRPVLSASNTSVHQH